ncbi:MAG: 2-amino-4-hydroxy-6-hydroxymethyldihydropteridine diphosphokinase [Bacteroidetes bacterium]|nr:2-amino-4-hydroxy-6-hydroxymethyldihydropteridine diphosphokinase [Bacteroidota bacterium]
MNKSYLLIGGNTGDRSGYLTRAAGLINASAGLITRFSSIYETAAWGKTDQPSFLNQALELETSLEPAVLMETLLSIEARLGRERLERYGPRVIDIDMLLYNDAVINTPLLTVPHPELSRRRFALEPLNEIAGHYVHPLLKKTIAQLLAECPDPLAVKKF